jgi:hypothetical protein
MSNEFSLFDTLHFALDIFCAFHFFGFFLEQLLKIGAFGTDPFVPKSKIQAIIVLELRMMQAVVRGSNPPFTKPMPMEIARIQFSIKVVDDARCGHYQ